MGGSLGLEVAGFLRETRVIGRRGKTGEGKRERKEGEKFARMHEDYFRRTMLFIFCKLK